MTRTPRGAGTFEVFDMAGASTHFWKRVPILTRAGEPGGDEDRRMLSVRILSGCGRQSSSLRILRVDISSEDDPLFLHTLEVSEDDFQALKVEQGIRVDFGSFPRMFVCLLDKCIECQGEDLPRFQAVLTASDGESKFQIFETNDFNKLPHVTLQFLPADDAVIKQFLAFHLSEMRQNCSRLESELKNSRREGRGPQGELGQTRGWLEEADGFRGLEAREVNANVGSARVAVQEESPRPREHSNPEQGLRDELEVLKARNERLVAENRELMAIKHEVSAKVSDLEHSLTISHKERALLQDDCNKLRDLNRQLSCDSKVSTRDLEEQDQERIDTLESAKAQLESHVEELKQGLVKAEERAKELEDEKKKTDEIVEKFAGDVQEAKAKTRKISAQMMRQEDVVMQLRSQLQKEADRHNELAQRQKETDRYNDIAQRQEDAVIQLTAQLQAAVEEKERAETECAKAQSKVSQLEVANNDLIVKLGQHHQRQVLGVNMVPWSNNQVADPQLPSIASRGRGFSPTVPLVQPLDPQMSSGQVAYPAYRNFSPVQPPHGQSPHGPPHLGQPPPGQERNPDFALRYQALRDQT